MILLWFSLVNGMRREALLGVGMLSIREDEASGSSPGGFIR